MLQIKTLDFNIRYYLRFGISLSATLNANIKIMKSGLLMKHFYKTGYIRDIYLTEIREVQAKSVYDT